MIVIDVTNRSNVNTCLVRKLRDKGKEVEKLIEEYSINPGVSKSIRIPEGTFVELVELTPFKW